MRKPIKPYKPYQPPKPRKTISFNDHLPIEGNFFDSKEIFMGYIESLDFDTVEISYTSEGTDFIFTKQRTEPNPHYDRNIKQYDIEIKKLKPKRDRYEEKLEIYNRKLEEYNKIESKRELKNKEKLFNKLKKELGK